MKGFNYKVNGKFRTATHQYRFVNALIGLSLKICEGIIIIIIIIIIIFINCNWVVTRWQWLFYMYTEYVIGY